MLRPLVTLPMPGRTVVKLREIGFLYCEDVSSSNQGITNEASRIIQCYHYNAKKYWAELTKVPETKSSRELLEDEKKCSKIVTFCREMDCSMDGGISVGCITEFCGAPGSGKTQMCLQLCVDVQIPKLFGGLEAKAIYVDTSGGFFPQRVHEIAEACVKHCQLVAFHHGIPLSTSFSTNSVMEGIHLIEASDPVEVIGAVHRIRTLLLSQNIKLVIIDSFTFPFRNDITNALQRTRLVYQIIGDLQKYAWEFKIAIVITNQLTTRVNAKESVLIPALGDTFGHRSNLRIMMGNLDNGEFGAAIFKSNSKEQFSVKFKIQKEGIRDCQFV